MKGGDITTDLAGIQKNECERMLWTIESQQIR